MADNDDLAELLYRAYNSPSGIVISTDDPTRTKQRLYAEQKKDPDLSCLSFLTSPLQPQSEIIIIRKKE